MITDKTLSTLDKICSVVMNSAPDASLVHLRIVLALSTEDNYRIVDLCEQFAGDPNSSSINAAVNRLGELGIVSIDRSGPKNSGYRVSLKREWKLS